MGVAIGVAACQAVAAGPILPTDCYGAIPYAFQGWTTLRDLGAGAGAERVYAMVTRDEIVLRVGPPHADGSSLVILGHGLCFAPEAGARVVRRQPFGPTRTEVRDGSDPRSGEPERGG